jgi:hypothetical protein
MDGRPLGFETSALLCFLHQCISNSSWKVNRPGAEPGSNTVRSFTGLGIKTSTFRLSQHRRSWKSTRRGAEPGCYPVRADDLGMTFDSSDFRQAAVAQWYSVRLVSEEYRFDSDRRLRSEI